MANNFRQKIQQLRAAQDTIVDLEALFEVSKLLHATVNVGGGIVGAGSQSSASRCCRRMSAYP